MGVAHEREFDPATMSSSEDESDWQTDDSDDGREGHEFPHTAKLEEFLRESKSFRRL